MRRKRFAVVAIAILLALGVWIASRTERPRATKVQLPTVAVSPLPNERPGVGRASVEAPTAEPRPTQSGAASPPQPTNAPPAPLDAEAVREADRVNLMIRDYRSIAGENPIGTNAEIMAAVMGNNPRHAKLGPPEGMQLNAKGELIDRWGTPYFFHQLSRDHMEIRSAGPDKVMWTDDDPVIR